MTPYAHEGAPPGSTDASVGSTGRGAFVHAPAAAAAAAVYGSNL